MALAAACSVILFFYHTSYSPRCRGLGLKHIHLGVQFSSEQTQHTFFGGVGEHSSTHNTHHVAQLLFTSVSVPGTVLDAGDTKRSQEPKQCPPKSPSLQWEAGSHQTGGPSCQSLEGSTSSAWAGTEAGWGSARPAGPGRVFQPFGVCLRAGIHTPTAGSQHPSLLHFPRRGVHEGTDAARNPEPCRALGTH